MNYLAMNYMYVVFCSKRLTSFLPFASVVILFFWIKLSTSETKYTPGGIFEEDIYTVKKKKKKKSHYVSTTAQTTGHEPGNAVKYKKHAI